MAGTTVNDHTAYEQMTSALNSLYLAVREDIAADVNAKVRAAYNELKAENTALELRINALRAWRKKERDMSYSIEVTGSVQDVCEKFDETHKSCAKYGMIEQELRDIDQLRATANYFATLYGRVHISASGHWNTSSGVPPSESNPGGTVSSFGRASITITPAPTPVNSEQKEGE